MSATTILYHTILCYTIRLYNIPCHAMPCHTMPYYTYTLYRSYHSIEDQVPSVLGLKINLASLTLQMQTSAVLEPLVFMIQYKSVSFVLGLDTRIQKKG